MKEYKFYISVKTEAYYGQYIFVYARHHISAEIFFNALKWGTKARSSYENI